jgi:uracil-DNA glycosylase family 4|tara:strand:- start:3307 stop:3972 length:666 start_codon:yes stop_codon:yes gene_type:complete
MNGELNVFDERVIACQKCPRLIEYARETKKLHKKKEFINEEYWCKPVPSFGSLDSELLIVGLAPGKHGAGRTGRPFTGDYAGDILYKALYESGLSNCRHSTSRSDNLNLNNVRISNAVRCAPPQNKPTNEEIINCRPFLIEEIKMMNRLKHVLALGNLAHRQIIQCIGEKQTNYKFKHNATHKISGLKWKLINSYHTSRYNINTKKLTYEMFLKVIKELNH